MTELPRDLLVFELDGALYAVDAARVRTTHWLPGLSPAPQGPAGIVGCFNLRGEIVPVADLAQRLGYGFHRTSPSDQVVVLDLDGTTLAVIAGHLLDLVHSSPEQFLPLAQGAATDGPATGALQLRDGLVTLLDVRRLPPVPGVPTPPRATPGQEATPEEAALYQARAQSLSRAAAEDERPGRSLAVVDLGGEYFGIDLGQVREFCRVPQVRPLPCCPPHVAGVFSLRGRLVTLLEVSSALGLPDPGAPRPKAIIGDLHGDPVGMGVDEVIDVFNPDESELRPAPAAGQGPGDDIRAVASFAGRRISVLDLPSLLHQERWVVNETVL